MLKVGTRDEYKVILAYNLTAVTHYSPHSRRMLYEVEFKHLVIMYRIGEFLLMTVRDIQHVLVHERRNLMEHMVGGRSWFHTFLF